MVGAIVSPVADEAAQSESDVVEDVRIEELATYERFALGCRQLSDIADFVPTGLDHRYLSVDDLTSFISVEVVDAGGFDAVDELAVADATKAKRHGLTCNLA